jgi:two-component system NarL family sensor kinase
MHFKTKIILLSVLPVLVMSVVLTALFVVNSKQLGDDNVADFTDKIIELRRSELKNYTQLALTAVNHIYAHAPTDTSRARAQGMAKKIFRDLRYGDDGYFFVYDYDGKNIVHPKQSYLEGQNLWHLRDTNGKYLIRSLVREAKKKDGGYTQYLWEKPSLNQQVEKLSFSSGLNKWRWMVGTGLYMDDVSVAIDSVEQTIRNNTSNIALITIAVTLLVVIFVAVIAIRLTVSQGQLASRQLQKLARSSMQEREQERAQVAAALNTGVANSVRLASKKLRQLVKDVGSGVDIKVSSTALQASLNNTLTGVLAIANDLHPEILVKKGLYAATEELAHQLSGKSGIKINVTAVNTIERPTLNIETGCYRIVLEALENVILHSSANETSIRMRQSRNLLSITIQDNGLGFDPYAKSNNNRGVDRGVGLSDMQLQTELMNGSFTLFSSVGTGTMIKIAIPL